MLKDTLGFVFGTAFLIGVYMIHMVEPYMVEEQLQTGEAKTNSTTLVMKLAALGIF